MNKLTFYGKCKNCGADKIYLEIDNYFEGCSFLNIKDSAGNYIINPNSNIMYHNCDKNCIGVFVIEKIRRQ